MSTNNPDDSAVRTARRPLLLLLPLLLGVLIVVAELLVTLIWDIRPQWWRIVPEVLFVFIMFFVYMRTRLSDEGRMHPRAHRPDPSPRNLVDDGPAGDPPHGMVHEPPSVLVHERATDSTQPPLANPVYDAPGQPETRGERTARSAPDTAPPRGTAARRGTSGASPGDGPTAPPAP